MRNLLEGLELREETTSASVYALFDGETMVGWGDITDDQWPYKEGVYPDEKDDQQLADETPTYDMATKQVQVAQEIIDVQEPDQVGWYLKLRLGGESPASEFMGQIESRKNKSLSKLLERLGVMSEAVIVTPADGREYSSEKEALADWNDDEDFILRDISSRWDGLRINKSQADKDFKGKYLNIRFKKGRKVAVLKIEA